MAMVNQVKLSIEQFLGGVVVEALSGQRVHFVRKHQNFLVCVVPNGHAFGHKTAQNAVGTLVNRPLPGGVGMGEVNLCTQCLKR